MTSTVVVHAEAPRRASFQDDPDDHWQSDNTPQSSPITRRSIINKLRRTARFTSARRYAATNCRICVYDLRRAGLPRRVPAGFWRHAGRIHQTGGSLASCCALLSNITERPAGDVTKRADAAASNAVTGTRSHGARALAAAYKLTRGGECVASHCEGAVKSRTT